MTKEDVPILEALSKKYFPEFENPTFTDKDYLSKFVVMNNEREIIIGGGIRQTAECILVTDKSKNVHSIGEALLNALRFSKSVCQMRHIELLYAFIQNENYKKHLIEHGFDPVKGDPLSLYIPSR